MNIISEKEVTIDMIVTEANQIYKEMKQSKVQFDDEAGVEQLMRDTRQRHPEFCQSYPIVHRYICQMQSYSAKAFTLWLKKIQHHPWKTEDGYLDAQADYVAMLFRDRKPRAPLTEINNIRRNIRKILGDEHAAFKRQTQLIEKEVDTESAALIKENKSELAEFVKLCGEAGLSRAGTVIVETDLTESEIIDVDRLCSNLVAVDRYSETESRNEHHMYDIRSETKEDCVTSATGTTADDLLL